MTLRPPTKRTQRTPEQRRALMAAICERMSAGELVVHIAPTLGLDRTTPWQWAKEDDSLREMYESARVAQAHAIAEDVLSISDGVDERSLEFREIVESEPDKRLRRQLDMAAVQRDRLRADSRKWLASKLAPRLYGDRLNLDHTAPASSAIVFLPALEPLPPWRGAEPLTVEGRARIALPSGSAPVGISDDE